MTGEPQAPPLKHSQIVWDVKFSHGGAIALTSCADGFLRAWHVSSGEPTGFVLKTPSTVWEMFFRRDDRAILRSNA